MDTPKEKHDHETLEFPDGFLWGAGSSAFQVEGNVINSDWWEWEQTHQSSEKRSGEAADHYNRYEEDFELAKELGHNSHRLSLEWSRIEPEEGIFNQDAIDHYIQVLKSLKEKNISVMLTLHHFSNPAWFAKKGGWTSFKAPFYFNRFVKNVVPQLKDSVDLWITINEPSVYGNMAYLTKEFPPQKKNPWLFLKSMWNMARAHKRAYKTIHKLVPDAKVGIAHAVVSFDSFHHHSPLELFAEFIADYVTNHLFLSFTGKKSHDFLGLNYYQHNYLSFNGERAKLPSIVDINASKKDISDLGWEIYPEGMFDIIMDFSDYRLPIYITENGIASTNDDRRVRFLITYLKEVYHAISSGSQIKGYFYWSLTDNMELHRGFDPRFGLIEVDFKTQKRTPRASSLVYKEIIKNNGIPHYLLKLLGHGIKVKEVLDNPHDI